MIRAKFVCASVEKTMTSEVVKLCAVMATTEENKAWSKYTPNGQLSLTITNSEAQGHFEPGAEYFLDVTPAT